MRLIGSSKSTANGLVMALVAGLLGTGVAVIGAASPAYAACSTSATSFGGGDGSSGSPYLIENKDHLALLSTSNGVWRGKHFKQEKNIDLEGCEWTPIGKSGDWFTGTYDGQNFEISGLSITLANQPNQNEIGLFGHVSQTTIRNLTVSGNIASNKQKIGGLVGSMTAATGFPSRIENVRSRVNITATSPSINVGGIAGELTNAATLLTFSIYEGNLSAQGNYLGGITGMVSAARVHSSYVRANITGASQFKGGINSWNDVTIMQSYSVAPGANFGITNNQLTAASQNNFWDISVGPDRANRPPPVATIDTARAAGKTTSEMKNIETYSSTGWRIVQGWESFNRAGWNDTTNALPVAAKIWGICSQVNDGYPFLLWEYTTDPCTSPPPPVVNNPPTSSAPAMSVPSSEVSGVSLSAGALANQTLVRVRLNRIPSSFEQFFIVVRLFDLQGVLIRELRVPVEPSTSSVEIPVDKKMGQFNVVALTSNAAGATAALSFDPQTVKQRAIRKATEATPRRLTGQSLDRDVVFTADSAALSAQMKRTLRQAARLAKASDSRVAVTGFAAASPKGTKFEKRLAERRALRVANFLRKQGLENWIYFHGLNSRQGSDFAGQPRRVEIRVLK